MKAYDNGCFVTIRVSTNEVDDFKSRWPCSGLPSRPIEFCFEKKNGDLVDIKPDIDGSAAVALSEDAWKFYNG